MACLSERLYMSGARHSVTCAAKAARIDYELADELR
jgi:hypothetical protein